MFWNLVFVAIIVYFAFTAYQNGWKMKETFAAIGAAAAALWAYVEGLF